MNTASTASQNIRETAKDARETIGEMRDAASKSAGDMQDDLQKLRQDFHSLADQVAEILANRGNKAWHRAKSSVNEALADAQDKGLDAANTVREASDHFIEIIDESVKKRPYATLAVVAGIAFLFGMTWRR